MTNMNDREKAFESKFAHDMEKNFKIEARCARIFGLWAAEHLGFTGAVAEQYAADVVATNLEEAGLEDMMRKVQADFLNKRMMMPEATLRSELKKSLEKASRQINGDEN